MHRILLLITLLGHLATLRAQVSDRKEIEMDRIKNSVVLFTFGQSNSANYGQGGKYLYTPRHEVYNYFNQKLYMAQDPLLGATGKGGSVWGITGDLLIEKKKAQAVTIIPIGIGGVKISEWAKGGVHHQLLEKTLDDIVRLGIQIDCICWHQGESDNIANTTSAQYMEKFLEIREAFRKRGIQAPFVVAVASYHPLCLEEDHGCSKEIRDAQKELARKYKDIHQGPDTDKLNKVYQRADGIHFSQVGQRQHAEMWAKILARIL